MLARFASLFALMVGAVLLLPSVAAPPVVVLQRYAGNPVLSPGPFGSWDSHNVIVGSVLQIVDLYHLWYWGSSDNFVFKIGHATSMDGVAWAKDPANPVLSPGPAGSWEERAVAHPEVLLEDGIFKMWYTGTDFSNTPGSIGFAGSPDGSTWTKHPNNPALTRGPGWDVQNIVNGAVLRTDAGYFLWYSGSSDGLFYYAGLATSADGISWTKHPSNPVMGLGPGSWESARVHPGAVFVAGSTIVMVYVGSDLSSQRIGLASSQDGVSWTKYPGNPILDLGSPGSWDDQFLSRADVLIVRRQLRMWYSGNGSGSDWQIGLATLRPGATRFLLEQLG